MQLHAKAHRRGPLAGVNSRRAIDQQAAEDALQRLLEETACGLGPNAPITRMHGRPDVQAVLRIRYLGAADQESIQCHSVHGAIRRDDARFGFRVANIDYPSRKLPIEGLAEVVGDAIRRRCSREKRIHFVTHSLGGIVLRAYLKWGQVDNLGRVVMLCPPNKGSELVDILRDKVLFKAATGPAGQELGTDSSSVPLALGPVDYEVGVIAGNKSLNPFFSRLIPGQDDGRVSVERTKVEGMADFLVVPQIHPLIMNSSKVIKQVAYFLENGRFGRLGFQSK